MVLSYETRCIYYLMLQGYHWYWDNLPFPPPFPHLPALVWAFLQVVAIIHAYVHPTARVHPILLHHPSTPQLLLGSNCLRSIFLSLLLPLVVSSYISAIFKSTAPGSQDPPASVSWPSTARLGALSALLIFPRCDLCACSSNVTVPNGLIHQQCSSCTKSYEYSSERILEAATHSERAESLSILLWTDSADTIRKVHKDYKK